MTAAEGCDSRRGLLVAAVWSFPQCRIRTDRVRSREPSWPALAMLQAAAFRRSAVPAVARPSAREGAE